jgi:hypothetical protein
MRGDDGSSSCRRRIGSACRRARLRALGNAVVPQCAEVAGRVIVEMLRVEAAS